MQNKWRWLIAQFFEIRWWKKYLQPKDWDSYLLWKTNYWQGVLEAISPFVPIETCTSFADIGCGPAGVFIALPDKQVMALDPLLLKYEAEIEGFECRNFPNVVFSPLPFESYQVTESFNAVFCMNAINHFQDLKGSFLKLGTMVKEKGYLVITIDGHRFSFFRWLFSWFPIDILHPHQYYLEEYIAMVGTDFTVLSTQLKKKEPLFNHYIIVFQKK